MCMRGFGPVTCVTEDRTQKDVLIELVTISTTG